VAEFPSVTVADPVSDHAAAAAARATVIVLTAVLLSCVPSLTMMENVLSPI